MTNNQNNEDNSPTKVLPKVLSVEELIGNGGSRITKIQFLELQEYKELVGFGAPIRIEKGNFWFKFFVVDRQNNPIEGTVKKYFYKDYTTRGHRKE